MSRWRSSAARKTLRPMRPKPLIPTLTMGPPETPVVYRSMSVQPIRWLDNELQLLDQRKLPREVVWVACRDAHEVAVAIRDMVVRGAPAIGVAAAFGIALAAMRGDDIK